MSHSAAESGTIKSRYAGASLATLGGGVLLCLLVLAAYHGTFSAPFIYDDVPWIVDGERIKQDLWPPAPFFNGSTLRPVLFYTLAINYRLGGLDVIGYHAVNLLIHAATALALFGLVRSTLGLPIFSDRYRSRAELLGFAAAALWAVHPLGTQAVTYTIQRAESLAALMLLLSLYGLLRAATSIRPLGWYLFSVLAAAVGSGCKEVMIVAPFVLLLYDRCFLATSLRELLSRRCLYYLALMVAWSVLIWAAVGGISTALAPSAMVESDGLTVPLGEPSNATRPLLRSPAERPSPWEYARTQPGAILHYLRLAVWPAPLCLDYDWPLATIREAIFPAVLLIVMILLSLLACWRSPPFGFLPVCFFLLLVPTSSFLPIFDPVIEHRMYLPLATVVIAIVLLLDAAVGPVSAKTRWSTVQVRHGLVVLLIISLLALTSTTIARNRDYQSREQIWLSVLDVYPNNVRALTNLAQAVRAEGRRQEAVEYLRRADRVAPRDPVTQGVIGELLLEDGQYEEAIERLKRALAGWPQNGIFHLNLGVAHAGRTEWPQAIEHYRLAIRLRPGMYAGHMNLGLALLEIQETEKGFASLQEAINRAADPFEPLLEMGVALARREQITEAVTYLERAVAAAPQRPEGHENLSLAYAQLGRMAEAIDHLRRAIASARRQGIRTESLEKRLNAWLHSEGQGGAGP